MDNNQRNRIDDNELKLIEESVLGIKHQEDNVIAEKQMKKSGIVDDVPNKIKEKVKSDVIDNTPPATTKDSLKKCICDMCDELGEPRPKSTFFRKPKAVLQDKVKWLTEKLEKKAMEGLVDKKRKMEMLEHPEKNPAALTLYNLNYMTSQLIESMSVAVKKKTYDIAVLEGFCAEITRKRNEFLRVFARLTDEHGEIINKYLSPATEYALLMLATAAPVVSDNIKKKKKTGAKESNEESPQL